MTAAPATVKTWPRPPLKGFVISPPMLISLSEIVRVIARYPTRPLGLTCECCNDRFSAQQVATVEVVQERSLSPRWAGICSRCLSAWQAGEAAPTPEMDETELRDWREPWV